MTVARRAGVSQATLSRLERGGHATTIRSVAVIAGVVGLDLSVRLFPGGAPVRDAAHLRLLARLQSALPGLRSWRAEVPLPIPGDQRAIDAVARAGLASIGFELETRLADAQAVARRATLKQRDAGLDRMVLVLADTRANRAALAAAWPTLRATFPAEPRSLLAALRAGAAPSANGTVLI